MPTPSPDARLPHEEIRLSVLVPVYDEAATVVTALERLLAVRLPCPVQVVCVDDGSTDASPGLLDRLATDQPRVTVLHHEHNAGKGAALRTAAAAATGTHVVIYDADLEYDPADLPALLEPVLRGRAQVVYGRRTFGPGNSFSVWYVLGNHLVTAAANLLFGAQLSDLETCWKLMPLPLYRDLDVRAQGFGTEAEVTGKLLRRGLRPREVPVTYRARSREAGKKLTWRDGVEALGILLRERVRRRPRP